MHQNVGPNDRAPYLSPDDRLDRAEPVLNRLRHVEPREGGPDGGLDVGVDKAGAEHIGDEGALLVRRHSAPVDLLSARRFGRVIRR